MQKFVTRKVNPRKNEILDRYMSSVNPQYEPKMIAFGRDDKCAWCGGPMEIFAVDGFSECTKCGMSESLLFETDRRSFKDAPAENSYFAYKRINHFREWLAQFQAKESTEIPQHVFDTLHAEIKKNKIADLKTLTPQRVREFLKRHRLNKYYEHCSNILYTLNGIPPPVLSKDDEERLCNAFKELQAPFAKVCPKVAPNRKNFMSYSFVLFKLAQLLEMDHLLECFSLLKSKEKLHVQQQIWEAICKELKWEILKTPM
jgi:hypothetical protein